MLKQVLVGKVNIFLFQRIYDGGMFLIDDFNFLCRLVDDQGPDPESHVLDHAVKSKIDTVFDFGNKDAMEADIRLCHQF